MADLYHLTNEQQELIDLLDNELNLTGEERAVLETRLAEIYSQIGNKLPELADATEYLTMQYNHALEKREALDKYMKQAKATLERIEQIKKNIFIQTGQPQFQIGSVVFKKHKLPVRLEITNPELVPDDFKTVKLTVPLYTARQIDFEHPELNLNIDDSRAEVKKAELKKLWQEGIETPGCQLIDNDFKVEVKGV